MIPIWMVSSTNISIISQVLCWVPSPRGQNTKSVDMPIWLIQVQHVTTKFYLLVKSDVRKSENYQSLLVTSRFFCGKIMQHHVKSPCWYPVDIHISPFTKPLFNSAHGWLNGMKTKPPMIAYSWHWQKGRCQWSSLLSGTTKYVCICIYIHK